LHGFSTSTSIVLYDRLLLRRRRGAMSSVYSSDEVLAVVSHEIGHWSLNHIPKLFIFYQVRTTTLSTSRLVNKTTGYSNRTQVSIDTPPKYIFGSHSPFSQPSTLHIAFRWSPVGGTRKRDRPKKTWSRIFQDGSTYRGTRRRNWRRTVHPGGKLLPSVPQSLQCNVEVF